MMKPSLKIAVLLTAFWLIILLFSFREGKAADYVFKDSDGNEVHLPSNLPVFLLDTPGVLAPIAPAHTPEIKTKIRKEGLESVREMTLQLPEPVRDDKKDRIKKIYLLDKDELIIGYYAFQPREQEASFRMNGIINYIRLVVECSHHGLWRKDIRFERQKS